MQKQTFRSRRYLTRYFRGLVVSRKCIHALSKRTLRRPVAPVRLVRSESVLRCIYTPARNSLRISIISDIRLHGFCQLFKLLSGVISTAALNAHVELNLGLRPRRPCTTPVIIRQIEVEYVRCRKPCF